MLTNPVRPGEPVLRVHGRAGPLWWPESEIALLRDEFQGRVEATHADGRVAHRPGPLPPLLHEVEPGVRVSPLHARLVEGALHLPGGWRLPAADLPPARPPAAPLPDVVLAVADRRLLTPSGAQPTDRTRPELLREHPRLLPAGRHLVDPGAVRALVRDESHARLTLEGGHELTAGWRSLSALFGALGLPEPLGELDRLGLRDWPTELLRMPRQTLEALFRHDPDHLVDQALWQTRRLRPPGHGDTHRGYHYMPLYPLAVRAGVAGPRAAADLPPLLAPRECRALLAASLPKGLPEWDPDELYVALTERLDQLVGRSRVLTFRDLGFRDPEPERRHVGAARPHVLLLAEKASLAHDARLVADRFGVSLLVLGGFPTWVESEFLHAALPPGPLRIVSFCDYDPYGWQMPAVLQRMLDRYGRASELAGRLVRPERFTPEELELLAIPLPPGKLTRDWVRETGGVGGRPLGLYADYLRPVERVLAAFQAETGL